MNSNFYNILRSEFYYLYFRKHKFRRKVKKCLKKYYSTEASIGNNSNKMVVYMADGKILHGGLGDRLRGIVSLFKVCEEKAWDFRIFFKSPFPLEKYLLPNLYDWRIKESEMSYNSKCSLPVYNSCIPEDNPRERRWQHKTLIRQLKPQFKQIHCYNSFYFADYDFKRIFNILFKPSSEITSQLTKIKQVVGEEYISISTRFLQLLGDFKETKDIYEVLNDCQAEKLMALCLKTIKEIQSKPENEGKYAIVTSDSRRFLDYVNGNPLIYTIPGSICHIDSKAEGSDEQLKTFVDFYAVKEAVRSYLIVGPGMYKASNFAKRAAQADGREVIISEVNY